jgi:hypothetical protein
MTVAPGNCGVQVDRRGARAAVRGPGRYIDRAALALILLLGIAPAAKAEPTAIVEEIDPPVDGIDIMSLLEPGEVIVLPETGTLVLGYLSSCSRETIAGGRVIIGREQSVVVDGEVERANADCASSQRRTGQRVQVMAGIVVRSLRPAPAAAGVPQPEPSAPPVQHTAAKARLTIGSTRPVVMVPEPELKLQIERVAARTGDSGERWQLEPEEGLVDLLASGVRLVPGATYLFTLGERDLEVQVLPDAAGRTPTPLERIIRF